ncbi:MAG: GIN domain-containing protein [Candidatus Limimorpha sp.]
MKSMRKAFFAFATLSLVALASCTKELDMTLVSKTLYENSAIDAIEAEQYWILNVVADSNSNGVKVEYSAYLDEYLDISLNNGLLKLAFKNQPYMSPSTRFQATVHLGNLNRMTLNGHAVANFEENAIRTSDLELTLKDKSVCKNAHFTGNACKIHLSGASELQKYSFEGSSCSAQLYDQSRIWGNISANDSLLLTLDNASRFSNYGGASSYADIRLDNSSEANLLPTQINNLNVELNNKAMATVTVSDLMTGSLQNTSTLHYLGTPQIEIVCDTTSKITPL